MQKTQRMESNGLLHSILINLNIYLSFIRRAERFHTLSFPSIL